MEQSLQSVRQLEMLASQQEMAKRLHLDITRKVFSTEHLIQNDFYMQKCKTCKADDNNIIISSYKALKTIRGWHIS